MEEVYKFAGRAIGGEKDEAIAKKVFGVVDLGLGLVSPAKLIAKFEKINTLADAAKYLKSIPGQAVTNVGKGVAYLKTVPKELGKVASTAYKTVKSAPAAMAKGVDKLAEGLNTAKKFAAGYKTTIKAGVSNLGEATSAGMKAYSNALNRLGIVAQSPVVEGVKEFKNTLAKLSKAGAGDASHIIKPTYYHSANPDVVDLMKKNGFRTDLPTPQQVFHNNRFGRGVYLGDSPATVLAERPGGTVLKIKADIGKNLNIVDRGVIDYKTGQSIARGARKHNFDSISFTSKAAQEQGFIGINTMIFNPKRIVIKEVLP